MPIGLVGFAGAPAAADGGTRDTGAAVVLDWLTPLLSYNLRRIA